MSIMESEGVVAVSDANMSFWEKVKDNWGIICTLVAVFAWIISQVIVATNAISVAQASIVDNKKSIIEAKEETHAHVKSETGHSKVAERLIKVETEVKHINTTQTSNFRDIKEQLKIIQQDVKGLRSR